ncbi:hypothetical protein X777_12733 [Ooceraea biroi]|uniref:Uncharacterized protein n=1 Tax=Ooceraea biroi TaxID=2015173 RepID=A0A026VYH2_OOCBI|nr:hypothetical protein X777_12733 [Ooceraea biroi]
MYRRRAKTNSDKKDRREGCIMRMRRMVAINEKRKVEERKRQAREKPLSA